MDTQQTAPDPQLAAVRSTFNSLSRDRQIALAAAALGLISTFFHWYSISAGEGAFSISASINGWHGWGYAAILGYVVTGAVALLALAGRTLRALVPSLPPAATDARAVLGAGAVAVLGAILFMTTEGTSASGPGFSAGPAFGAYLGLLCGIAIAVGGLLMQQEPGAA